MKHSKILSLIPEGLRKPLLDEYNDINQRFLERRWGAAELCGGRFSEIVFTILDGHSKGVYAPGPYKPANFVDSCRGLEKNTHVPRSFQILIPRLLPALYEIRNNRNVGHVGGDVDSNSMDAQAVISMCSWILGELIRVFHNVSIKEAQKEVDFITNRKVPLIWETANIKRVLNPKISLRHQILLLLSSSPSSSSVLNLMEWIGCKDKKYFLKLLRELHKLRQIELSANEREAELLPPGMLVVEKLLSKLIV